MPLLVVADTGPLNYLVLIEAIDILPKLFATVLIPETVRAELLDPGASPRVRAWAEHPPTWSEIRVADATALNDPTLQELDEGEAEAIALARSVSADFILMDDRAGVAAAARFGFEATGTLGVLARAARHGLIDLPAAFARLRATNFRYRQELLDTLLTEHAKRGSGIA
jgi:predicted nucleic acid-binding protein